MTDVGPPPLCNRTFARLSVVLSSEHYLDFQDYHQIFPITYNKKYWNELIRNGAIFDYIKKPWGNSIS